MKIEICIFCLSPWVWGLMFRVQGRFEILRLDASSPEKVVSGARESAEIDQEGPPQVSARMGFVIKLQVCIEFSCAGIG